MSVILFKTYEEHSLEEEDELYDKYLYCIPFRTKEGIVNIYSDDKFEAEYYYRKLIKES